MKAVSMRALYRELDKRGLEMAFDLSDSYGAQTLRKKSNRDEPNIPEVEKHRGIDIGRIEGPVLSRILELAMGPKQAADDLKAYVTGDESYFGSGLSRNANAPKMEQVGVSPDGRPLYAVAGEASKPVVEAQPVPDNRDQEAGSVSNELPVELSEGLGSLDESLLRAQAALDNGGEAPAQAEKVVDMSDEGATDGGKEEEQGGDEHLEDLANRFSKS